MPWPLAIVLLTLGGLLVLLQAGPRLFRGTRPVPVPGFRCPLTGERVDVEFQVTAWTGERVAVTRCNAFTPATAITCERRCLGPRAALAAMLAAALLAGPGLARAGDIVGSVRLEGPPPPVSTVRPTADHAVCGDAPRPAAELRLSPEGGVEHAVVFLAGERLEGWRQPSATFVLDQRGCVFVPRLLLIPPGASVEVHNSDPILHNFHTVSALGPGVNLGQRAGGRPLRVRFDRPEWVEVRCDVHGTGYMRAWIVVTAHPFYAATDARGRFRLPAIPPGPHTLAAWHELLGRTSAPVTVGPSGEVTVELVFAGASPTAAGP
ncbi:MAG TPA: carboxypeptidase regulatory-like domain-containing protein [Calidithermus sp.]|nr:carboxypeptidase regulatory-like domain-containing protein [Calidithermus sp.]